MKKKLIVLVLMAIVTISFAQEKKFQKACKENTVASYNYFIFHYPASEYTEEATFKKAVVSQTIEGWAAYFKKYPDGKFISEETILNFYSLVMNSGEIDDFELFLKRFPFSHYSEEVTFNKAKLLNTFNGWNEFVRKYPESHYLKQYEGVYYSKVCSENTIDGYKLFLMLYPNSENATKVKNTILQVEKTANTKKLQTEYNNLKKVNEIDMCSEIVKQTRLIKINKEFLEKHPEGEYIIEGYKSIDKYEFEKVKSELSIQLANDFITNYPESEYRDSTQIILAILKEYESAGQNRTKLNSFINKYPDSKISWRARQTIEDGIINDILTKGIGNRFTIKEILPEKNGTIGSIVIKAESEDSDIISINTLYPKDKILFDLFSMDPIYPTGNLSVIRFIGRVKSGNYFFTGDENDPLSFIYMEKSGFVYLHGKGRVENNGKITKLGF